MKKNIATTILSVAAAATVLTATAAPVSAASLMTAHETASSLGKSFSSDWSKKIEFSYYGTMVSGWAGYDTDWVNEDYIKNCFVPTGYYVQGRVENGCAQSAYTNKDSGFPTGKADVVHFGKNVDYWIYLTD